MADDTTTPGKEEKPQVGEGAGSEGGEDKKANPEHINLKVCVIPKIQMRPVLTFTNIYFA